MSTTVAFIIFGIIVIGATVVILAIIAFCAYLIFGGVLDDDTYNGPY